MDRGVWAADAVSGPVDTQVKTRATTSLLNIIETVFTNIATQTQGLKFCESIRSKSWFLLSTSKK